MRRRMMFLVVAAAVAAGVSACEPDLPAGSGQEPAPPGDSTNVPAGTPAPAGTGEPGDLVASPEPAPPAGGVLASREVQDRGHDLLFEITGLRRQGATLGLQWRITLVQANEAGDRWSPWSKMGSGSADFTVSGVTLVDPVNAQRYLPARSGGEDGECACSQSTNFYIEEGDTADFFANYAAPPADVTTLNVEFPRFGAFTDVPVT